MMITMKFSVIIPFYFSQKHISKCLDSLLAQKVTGDFEILCCGDKVDDPTFAIIEEYAEKYPGKVQLLKQEGRGISGARNLGLLHSKGQYIMFVDADDTLEPDILALCEKAMVDTGADFACVAFDRISPDGKRYSLEQSVPELTITDVTPEIAAKLAFIPTAPWGKLFRRELLSGITFPEYPISCYEDCIFLLSIHPRVKRYVIVPKVLYHYLVHDEQSIQTSSCSEKTQKFRNDMIDLRNKFIEENIPEPYLKMLDIAALIHVGIADAHRAAEAPGISVREFCAGAKIFLNENFPGWRKIKLRPYGVFTIRCKAVWILKNLYKINVAWIFILCYNWFIKTLHIDVKW